MTKAASTPSAKAAKRKQVAGESKSTPMKTLRSNLIPMDPELVNAAILKKKQVDDCTLFIKHFGRKTTDAALRALSSDIIELTRVKNNSYAFISFANPKICEANFEKLKSVKINSKDLFVDHCGEKGNAPVQPKAAGDFKIDPLTLHISSQTQGAKLQRNELQKFFPGGKIMIPKKGSVGLSPGLFKYAHVYFDTEELATAALKKNKSLSINGCPCVVSHKKVILSGKKAGKK